MTSTKEVKVNIIKTREYAPLQVHVIMKASIFSLVFGRPNVIVYYSLLKDPFQKLDKLATHFQNFKL